MKCSRVKCKDFSGFKDKESKPCPVCLEEDKKTSPREALRSLEKHFIKAVIKNT